MKRVFDFADGFTSDTDPSGSANDVVSTQSVTDASTIALAVSGAPIQILKIQGNGGAVTTATDPFDSNPTDGTIIILRGMDATNTVTINDSANIFLNGDITLGENDALTLYYDSTDDLFVELSRSF